MILSSSVFYLLFVCTAVEALPYYKSQMEQIIGKSPCLTSCMRRVESVEHDLSIAKTHNYARFIINLDEICRHIAEARSCVDRCNISSNPFRLRFMSVMCQPDVLKEAQEHQSCFERTGHWVHKQCTKDCGDIDAINADIAKLSGTLKQNTAPNFQLQQQLMATTNTACGLNKCFARCSRSLFSVVCRDQRDPGLFLQRSIERTLDAMHQDLVDQKVTDTMREAMPEQCNYLHVPNVMFDANRDRAMMEELVRRRISVNRAKNAQPNNLLEMQQMNDLQKNLMLEEYKVLQKQERNLDKESRKLDLQIQRLQSSPFMRQEG